MHCETRGERSLQTRFLHVLFISVCRFVLIYPNTLISAHTCIYTSNCDDSAPRGAFIWWYLIPPLISKLRWSHVASADVHRSRSSSPSFHYTPPRIRILNNPGCSKSRAWKPHQRSGETEPPSLRLLNEGNVREEGQKWERSVEWSDIFWGCREKKNLSGSRWESGGAVRLIPNCGWARKIDVSAVSHILLHSIISLLSIFSSLPWKPFHLFANSAFPLRTELKRDIFPPPVPACGRNVPIIYCGYTCSRKPENFSLCSEVSARRRWADAQLFWCSFWSPIHAKWQRVHTLLLSLSELKSR